MDINRRTAYNVLVDVEKKKSYSNIALNKNIERYKPNSEPFVRQLVYGVLENLKLLDYVIDQLIPKDVAKMKINELIILRMGVYQLAKMDSVPEYAAVNESVILAKKYARGKDKLVNGVLRSYINSKYAVRLPDRAEDEIKYLSIKYSFEPWIIKLWLESYDMEFVEELLAASNETPDTVIRLNWLRVVKKDLVKSFEDRGFQVADGKYSQNALHVKGSGLINSQLYKSGIFSIQDEASQLAAQMLDPKHGELIMDMCAAPGGKSLAIAERMNNRGTVIASDIYDRKTEIINAEARRLGVSIIKTQTWDATKVESMMVGKADRVIVDAPCSGLGVIRRKPEIKYKKYTDEMALLPKKQLSILSASSRYVKKGGMLMYCTCTINHYENERVVSDFLRKNSDFKVVETKQLFPNINGTDGFFICTMLRENSLI